MTSCSCRQISLFSRRNCMLRRCSRQVPSNRLNSGSSRYSSFDSGIDRNSGSFRSDTPWAQNWPKWFITKYTPRRLAMASINHSKTLYPLGHFIFRVCTVYTVCEVANQNRLTQLFLDFFVYKVSRPLNETFRRKMCLLSGNSLSKP